MVNRTRAYRRNCQDKAKRYAKRIIKWWKADFGCDYETMVGMLSHTRKLCSCDQCGNPRKYG